jgi:fructose-bisphosphate aldolase, class I
MIGSQIRLRRLMDSADGRSYIVAADHAFLMGPSSGTYSLENTLAEVVCGNPDGILLSKGRARLLSNLFEGPEAPALIIRADWFSGPRFFSPYLPLSRMDNYMACGAEEALALGAEALMFYFLAGFTPEYERRCYAIIAAAVRESESLGLPLVAEPLPGNPTAADDEKNSALVEAARSLEALGASALKVPFINDEGLEQLIAAVSIPVWVLGGAKEKEELAIYEKASAYLSLGARGIVFGRNVIQADNPAEVSLKLNKIVHG